MADRVSGQSSPGPLSPARRRVWGSCLCQERAKGAPSQADASADLLKSLSPGRPPWHGWEVMRLPYQLTLGRIDGWIDLSYGSASYILQIC